MDDINYVKTTKETNDAEKNKVVAALAYLIFFIPLIADQKSEFGRFHANQGLVLLLLAIAISIVGAIIPFIGWFVILPLGGLLCLVFAIIGIVNSVNLKTKELPLIGALKIIN